MQASVKCEFVRNISCKAWREKTSCEAFCGYKCYLLCEACKVHKCILIFLRLNPKLSPKCLCPSTNTAVHFTPEHSSFKVWVFTGLNMSTYLGRVQVVNRQEAMTMLPETFIFCGLVGSNPVVAWNIFTMCVFCCVNGIPPNVYWQIKKLIFEFLTAVLPNIKFLLDVTPCLLVNKSKR